MIGSKNQSKAFLAHFSPIRMAPANTPNGIVQKLYQDIFKALAMPEVRSRLTDLGLVVVARTPQEFAAQIKDEIVKKGQLIKDSGAKPG